jgi:hypothetical protein
MDGDGCIEKNRFFKSMLWSIKISTGKGNGNDDDNMS